MARLGDICKINMGQSPDSSSYNDKNDGLPFFQGNADFGELYPTVRVWCSQPSKVANKNDILISVRAPIGALNIADCECCIGRGIAALTVDENACFQKYLWHALHSKVDELNSKGTGSTFKAINKRILEETEIPLPPLDEQRKIAAVLDKISDLTAKRRRQLDKLDELVKSRFVEMFGDLRTNNKRLPIVSLKELGDWNSGGTPSRSKPEYFCGDIDWYSAGELNSLYLQGSVEKITQEALDDSAAKLFKQGSMLIGMYDTAAFKMGILRKASTSNQACACIEPNERVDVVWLYYTLLLMKDYFLQQRRGARQKNLNLGMLKSFEIPLI